MYTVPSTSTFNSSQHSYLEPACGSTSDVATEYERRQIAIEVLVSLRSKKVSGPPDWSAVWTLKWAQEDHLTAETTSNILQSKVDPANRQSSSRRHGKRTAAQRAPPLFATGTGVPCSVYQDVALEIIFEYITCYPTQRWYHLIAHAIRRKPAQIEHWFSNHRSPPNISLRNPDGTQRLKKFETGPHEVENFKGYKVTVRSKASYFLDGTEKPDDRLSRVLTEIQDLMRQQHEMDWPMAETE